MEQKIQKLPLLALHLKGIYENKQYYLTVNDDKIILK